MLKVSLTSRNQCPPARSYAEFVLSEVEGDFEIHSGGKKLFELDGHSIMPCLIDVIDFFTLSSLYDGIISYVSYVPFSEVSLHYVVGGDRILLSHASDCGETIFLNYEVSLIDVKNILREIMKVMDDIDADNFENWPDMAHPLIMKALNITRRT